MGQNGDIENLCFNFSGRTFPTTDMTVIKNDSSAKHILFMDDKTLVETYTNKTNVLNLLAKDSNYDKIRG